MTDTSLATIDNMLNGRIDFHNHKIRTAYALNLCTVSVSQIIDYEDIMILEHEYDAILNNLNIESLPNDEALLAILKQLLDTITFFRIEEGDKQFIDREYQNNMKNAIWNAVPNMGLILAGGSPLTLAIALASQVGVGYMNYRRTKAENAFAREKAMWQLQRAAIEQFNGLRRELFDTAWRLVNAHDIPDVYRLTERQVKQYNAILMDPDLHRKYERLDTIKENFVAYPPFWYFFGNTANALSKKVEAPASDYYKNVAKQYFEIFVQAFSACNLLRENQVASACALEYIDLLDAKNPEENQKIRDLLKFAVKMSGNANDVLQLCAFAYLKVGDSHQAANLFRCLVNENYNTTVNAQLLSSYYVSSYLTGDVLAKSNYDYLRERVDERYLYPFPEQQVQSKDTYLQLETIQTRFAENQRDILGRKYQLVIEQFKNQYQIRFNRCIPAPDFKNHPDSYYDNNVDAFAIRKEAGSEHLSKSGLRQYQEYLQEVDYPYNYISVLNNMLNDVNTLPCVQGHEHTLCEDISNGVLKIRDKLMRFAEAADIDYKFSVTIYYEMVNLSFESITADFFERLSEYVERYVNQKNTIQDMNDAETSLREFCLHQGFKTPDVMFDTEHDLVETPPLMKKYLGVELILDGVTQKDVDDRFEAVRDIILLFNEELCKPGSNARMIMSGEEAFDRYFIRLEIPNKTEIRRKTVAVLDDMSAWDNDLIFTTDGIMQIVRGKMQRPLSYDNVYYNKAEEKVLLVQEYKNPDVDMQVLIQMLEKLGSKAYVTKEKKRGFWVRG